MLELKYPSKHCGFRCNDHDAHHGEMTTVEAPIGAKVQVAAGVGYVRWSGANPKFASGKWVGVEL